MFAAAQAEPLQELHVANYPAHKKQRTQHGKTSIPFERRIAAARDADNDENRGNESAEEENRRRTEGIEKGSSTPVSNTKDAASALAIAQEDQRKRKKDARVQREQVRLGIDWIEPAPVEKTDENKIEEEREGKRLTRGKYLIVIRVPLDIAGDAQQKPESENEIEGDENEEMMDAMAEESVDHAAVIHCGTVAGVVVLRNHREIPMRFDGQRR